MGNALAPSPPAEATCTRIEYWFRPLLSDVASALGGRHSFVILHLSSGRVYKVEKHHDGQVEWELQSQKEQVALAMHRIKDGWVRERVAFFRPATSVWGRSGGVREGVTLAHVRDATAEHEGYYDVHDNNGHLLSQCLWNAVVEADRAMVAQDQAGLTKVAQWFGVGASMRRDAAANAQAAAVAETGGGGGGVAGGVGRMAVLGAGGGGEQKHAEGGGGGGGGGAGQAVMVVKGGSGGGAGGRSRGRYG